MDKSGQLTPSQTTEILKILNHAPVKKLGQNFLVDSNIVRKSLDLADVRAGDNIVEVGPGLGTLTGALLERGAKVYAVEFDKRLYAYLEEHFAGTPNLNLINADAVDFPLAALPPDIENFKIVANLPYAISTPWLDAVLAGRLPAMMSLMLQKEAAMRFAAKCGTGEYSPISIFLGQAYDIPPMHKVSAACFHPRPNVDSALLPLRLKPDAFTFAEGTKILMRAIFSMRRKQIGSIAKSLEADAKIVTRWLASDSSPRPDARPETISPQHWKALDAMVKTQA